MSSITISKIGAALGFSQDGRIKSSKYEVERYLIFTNLLVTLERFSNRTGAATPVLQALQGFG